MKNILTVWTTSQVVQKKNSELPELKENKSEVPSQRSKREKTKSREKYQV
jgi:hypothetical protein